MSVKTAVEIGNVLKPVQGGLTRVEAKMQTVESSLFAPLASAFVDLIGSGGKRLRPALALMAAQVRQELEAPYAGATAVETDTELDRGNDGGANGPGSTSRFDAVIALAASVEMLHTASLVHDDVIDGALLRRGSPTLNALWNRGSTVLAGNFMFARAAYFAAETQNMRVIHIFSDTLETIVDGELHQLSARHDFYQDKATYYQRIYAKTASLFCAATKAAAVLSNLDEEEIHQLHHYGYNLGMAFQIVDDILDFTGTEDTLGKPAGSDLRSGTLTLPFFYFLQEQPNMAQLVNRMEAAYELAADGDEAAWQELVDEIVQAIRTGSAVDAARREAIHFLDLARANLALLPNSRYRSAMLELCDFVVQRTY